MKKLLSIILSIAVLLTMVSTVSFSAFAAASGTDGGLAWSLSDDGVLTVSRGSGNRGGDHTVSKKWYETSYTYSSPYHAYKNDIRKIVIENGVEAIGENAFYDLSNVTSVSMADSVNTIGYHAFAKCTSLQGIALPANCTWYWAWIFEDCTALKWAILPTKSNDGLVTSGTFKNCSSLETVFIGSKHTGLGDEAFNGCTSLKTIIWSTGNVSVGSNALNKVPTTCKVMGSTVSNFERISNTGSCGDNLTFEYDYSSRGIIISGTGSKITSMPWSDYKELITSVDMSNITSASYDICDDAFNGCINLSSVNFGNNLLRVGTASFKDCTSLKTVNFPNSMDTLGGWAFQNCTSLENVTLPNNCTWYWQYAFENCSALKWAILPTSNNSFGGKIPNGLFKDCTSLENVYVGDNHTGIGEQTFYNCYNLKGIIWNRSSVTVDNEGLYNVPASMKAVGTSIDGFDSQTLSGKCGDNMNYSYDVSTMKLTITGKGDMWENPVWSSYNNFIKVVDFSSITEDYNIVTSAFNNCKNLENVYFGDYLRNIGWGAFMNCSSIRYIVIPNSVENIWGCAFENCTGIDSVDFREGGTRNLYIREYSFKNLNHSTWWLNIPERTVMIGTQAFYGSSFNYIKVFAKTFDMGEDAFFNYGNYARFMGVGGSPLYDFIKSGQSKGYDWYYNCVGNHSYTLDVVGSNCQKLGYHKYSCQYCDDNYKEKYVEPSDHTYKLTNQQGTIYTYNCSVCGSSSLQFEALELMEIFSKVLSTSVDYNPLVSVVSCCDLNGDGYANAKDYLILRRNIANTGKYSNRETTIDTSTTYQTIEGFGASACWWSQTAGTWDNIDEIMEYLYGSEKGIGMNIYRYNLGAGSKFTEADKTDNSKTYCFLNADGTYNWNADKGAMNALASAQKANPNLKVTLFCNSAPVSMTDNGLAHTTTGRSKNLSENKFQAFADFVVTCTEHFIDEGYNVTNVSPINEPEFAWDGSNQEGCHWDSDYARKFYNNYMIPAMRSSQKMNGKVELSVWESGGMDYNVWSSDYLYNLFSKAKGTDNQNIRDYVDSVDTHSYWAGTEGRVQIADLLKDSNYSDVKKVRCTEYCQMTTDRNTGVYGITLRDGTTNGTTIEYGLAMADIIYQDMTIVNAVEWDWWTGAAGGIYPDGLVYLNYSNPSDVQTSKRLWCMGNYSKFIQVGAKRIKVTTGSNFGNNAQTGLKRTWQEYGNTYEDKNAYVEQSAYLNPDGSVVVVYINNSDTVEHTTFDTSKFSSFKTYVTDAYNDLEMMQDTSTSNTAIIPANSVTTVVLR